MRHRCNVERRESNFAFDFSLSVFAHGTQTWIFRYFSQILFREQFLKGCGEHIQQDGNGFLVFFGKRDTAVNIGAL